MLGVERGRALHRLLRQNGSLRVAVEAQRFGVSEETIRRDIKRLAADGLAVPVFGGAVLDEAASAERAAEVRAAAIPPVSQRRQEGAKAAIARVARDLVEPGQVVILDAGTTTLALARALGGLAGLTIVTNSLEVAGVCAGHPEATTYVLGGRVVPGSLGMIGPQAEHELAGLNADWAFLGAAAVEVGGAFTSADPYEAAVKRAMIRAARRAAVLADATKFGARRLAAFARPEDIDCLVTTPDAPSGVRAWIEGAGARLTLSDKQEGEGAESGR